MIDYGSDTWPSGRSTMAGLVRNLDWAQTPLGPVSEWPQSLRTVVDLMMANPVANILVCGPERVIIYNDACIPLYGEKHPETLGKTGPQAFPELWSDIGPLYDRVFAGEELSFQAQPWTFDRGATRPMGLYDAHFAPGRDENGDVSFAFVTAIEVADKARSQQALRESEERQAFLLRFSDALREEDSPDALAERALRMLCQQLRLDRCFVGVYQLADDRAEFTHQVGNDFVPPLPVSARLSDFPEALQTASDQTLVVNDTAQATGLSDADKRSLGGLGLNSLVVATIRKGENTPLWSIVAVSAQPR